MAAVAGLLATGASAASAANWVQYGENALHTSLDGSETTLTLGDVHRLGPAWSRTLGAGVTGSSPIVAGGRVFLVTDAGGGTVRAFSEATGAPLWSRLTCSSPGPQGQIAQPAYANGLVLVGDSGGDLAAYRAGTGAMVSCFDEGGSITSAPAVLGGITYVTTGSGVVAQRQTTGSGGWRIEPLFIQPTSTPAVGHGMVIVTGQTTIAAFRRSDGAPLWHRDLGSLLSAATISPDGTRVYVGGAGLFALRASTGATVWMRNPNGSNMSTPAVAGGRVFSNSEDVSAGLFAYNTSGHPLWVDPNAGESLATVSVADGVVYNLSDGGYLEALNPATGALVRQVFPPGETLAWDIGNQPAVVDGRVFAVSQGGVLPGPTRLDAFGLK